MRFKRITAALDDDARARLCQSSGSEHSAANSVTELSDLVDSFFEGGGGDDDRGELCGEIEANGDLEEKERFCNSESETKEMLMDLIGGGMDDDEDERVKCAICFEVETVCRSVENCSENDFKRSVITGLRQRGFDAGLCKSRWEKTGRHPAGEYEYIDVLISNTRYIVEVSIISEFTIARPTKTYQSLLETLPNIIVIKHNDLKKLVRLMCAAMRASLKTSDMMVSPWRKNGYMQSKWFGSYKRTTNVIPSRSREVTEEYGGGEFAGERLLGFEYSPVTVRGENYCRKAEGMHVLGNLKALMLSGM